ncbi:MAG: AAA family ATPase [Candidatus Accumulibacter sp. UW26]
MRIDQLDLKAYGHFTGQRLDFRGQAGLHIVCGANEAGKTTLWRAINGALFGVPEQTRDGHLHGNPQLRVGLVLRSAAGEQLALMRRKGRVNTLLGYDPQSGDELPGAVSEDRLREWLGGLGQSLFLAMFSLDHDALVRGGEALVQGRGEAGESLFEAGAGLSSIRALRSRLDREAEALFRPRASTSVIYRSLAEYEEARKSARQAIVRPAEWSTRRTAMATAARDYDAARTLQARLQKESRRLERLAATLPDIAARELALARQAELASVPLLPPSAAAERIAAVTRRTQAIAAENNAARRLDQHQGELDAIAVSEEVLADAEAIEALHHSTPATRDAALQAAKAEAAMALAQSVFDELVRQIASASSAPDAPLPAADAADFPLADPLQLIPDPTRVARIRGLITAGATLKAAQQAATRALAERSAAVEQIDAALLALGDEEGSIDLGAYLDSIADLGDPQTRAQQLEDEVKTIAARLDAEAGKLGMPSVAALERARIPFEAELTAARSEHEERVRRLRSIRQATERIENDLATLQGEIKGLAVRGEVPTREAVIALREERDRLWLGIRRHYLPSPGDSPPPPPGADSFELAVGKADQAADSLFMDAEKATRYAEYRVREAQMLSTLALEQGRAAATSDELQAIEQRWADRLAANGLPALSITEAAPWIARREIVLQRFEACERERHEAALQRAHAAEIRRRIGDVLTALKMPPPAAGERLSEILSRARAIARRNADVLTERQLQKSSRLTAEAALRRARAAAEKCDQALLEWDHQWRDAMAALRLEPAASEQEATARLEQFTRLAQAHAALARGRAEQAGARAQIDDYEARLGQVWARVWKMPLADEGRSADTVVGELYRLLVEMRSQQEKRSTLRQQIADDRQALADARQARADASLVIDHLLQRAACSELEKLELVEGQSARRQALASEIHAIEARLVQSAGLPLVDALQQAAGQDPDAVADALDRLSREQEECGASVQECHAVLIAAKAAFEQSDGSAAAAEAQQKMAQQAARIAELGADYAAARIASAVLARVVDSYQKRNQGPLVERAAKCFAGVTSGRFSGIAIDYDEEKQILVAVRADGKRLTMDQLSTGRRDQLFLALRLAAIEGHVDTSEPLPVIVDDLLIQFDDQAAAATFRVLADLARRTQILFLTHHEHLLEVANAAIGADTYRTHRI